jgi:hypothetical protein
MVANSTAVMRDSPPPPFNHPQPILHPLWGGRKTIPTHQSFISYFRHSIVCKTPRPRPKGVGISGNRDREVAWGIHSIGIAWDLIKRSKWLSNMVVTSLVRNGVIAIAISWLWAYKPMAESERSTGPFLGSLDASVDAKL